MDFDPFKDTVNCVGVFSGKLLGVFQRVCLDHDEAPGLIGKRSRQDNPTGLIKRFKVRQMGWAVYFSFGFALRAIKTDDDEFHDVAKAGLDRPFERAAVFVSGSGFVPPFDL